MYTRHGHQIPGTTVDTPHPITVARCGGVGLCRQCSKEARAMGYIHPGEELKTVELGPQTLAALRQTMEILSEERRPLASAHLHLNSGKTLARVRDVIMGSSNVFGVHQERLVQELLDAGIEFYWKEG